VPAVPAPSVVATPGAAGAPGPTHRSPAEAAVYLAAGDPVLAELLAAHGPPPRRRPVRSAARFGALAEIIVFQQLAGKAAASIHRRLVDALGGSVTADSVLAASPETLTGSGLSGSKAAALRDLAIRTADGRLRLDRIGRLSDDSVCEHLVQVRGVGPWSADMFLLSVLGRLDVWPVGDYGVRVGFARAWRLPSVPSPKELVTLGEPFRPYRSLVAWYCWRVLDQAPPGTEAADGRRKAPVAPATSGRAPVRTVPASRSPRRRRGGSD